MKKLRVTFLNEDGSKKNMTFQHVAQDLTPEAVYAAMTRLTELGIFEKNGCKLMVKVLRACYVDSEVVELFSVSSNGAGEEILLVNPEVNAGKKRLVKPVSFLKSIKLSAGYLFKAGVQIFNKNRRQRVLKPPELVA